MSAATSYNNRNHGIRSFIDDYCAHSTPPLRPAFGGMTALRGCSNVICPNGQRKEYTHE